MRTIIAAVFKYLAWALLILVALLYFENYEVRSQGLIILVGVISIDILFGIAGVIRRAVEKSRKRKLAAAKALKNAGSSVKNGVKSAGETVKSAGNTVADTCTDAWTAIKEKGASIGASIRGALPTSDRSASTPALTDGKDGKENK